MNREQPTLGGVLGNPWLLATAMYAGLAVASALLVSWLRQGNPLRHPSPWIPWEQSQAAWLSGILGLLFALLVIRLTRWSVARYRWAQTLHGDLRPVVRGWSLGAILLLAILSSTGEELLFRSLLVPWLGIVPASFLFGLAHQLRGPSRWVWVSWAAVAGAGFGVLFAFTGSLVGCLLAHALINGANLIFLRDHDPAPPTPFLGGLLGGRSRAVREQDFRLHYASLGNHNTHFDRCA